MLAAADAARPLGASGAPTSSWRAQRKLLGPQLGKKLSPPLLSAPALLWCCCWAAPAQRAWRRRPRAPWHRRRRRAARWWCALGQPLLARWQSATAAGHAGMRQWPLRVLHGARKLQSGALAYQRAQALKFHHLVSPARSTASGGPSRSSSSGPRCSGWQAPPKRKIGRAHV